MTANSIDNKMLGTCNKLCRYNEGPLYKTYVYMLSTVLQSKNSELLHSMFAVVNNVALLKKGTSTLERKKNPQRERNIIHFTHSSLKTRKES